MDAMLLLFACIISAGAAYFVLSRKFQAQLDSLGGTLRSEEAKTQHLKVLLDQSQKNFADTKTGLAEALTEVVELKETNAGLTATCEAERRGKTEANILHEKKCADLQVKLDELQEERDGLVQKVAGLEESEEQRRKDYDAKVARINTLSEQVEKDRNRELAAKAEAEQAKHLRIKETWVRHEKSVEEQIKKICQQHGLEYVGKEKFPLRGKPDNCVKICDEFIIFDSKSPQGEDLGNFPAYIKAQAEAVNKYAKHETVRKDLYFVIPLSAAESIEEKVYDQGTYRVYVITEDALEPVLTTLKRIEDYEFADKLDPADRDKIVTTLGKMAHSMKRRIQIDHFFANNFIAVLTDAENLPADILEDAQKVERNSKLNPPLERRAKVLEMKDIQKESDKLVEKAGSQDIQTAANWKPIDEVPLHKNATAGENES